MNHEHIQHRSKCIKEAECTIAIFSSNSYSQMTNDRKEIEKRSLTVPD